MEKKILFLVFKKQLKFLSKKKKTIKIIRNHLMSPVKVLIQCIRIHFMAAYYLVNHRRKGKKKNKPSIKHIPIGGRNIQIYSNFFS